MPTGSNAANRYNVNLPVGQPAGSIAFLGILAKNFLVDLELSAAQTENRGTVISSPRVITANQKEADDRAGCRNSLSAVGLERRDHDRVQEGGARR